MNDPIISIIIPVYNAERFLSAAIDSVLAQTYKDWELILIDDGSTDRSRIICEHYASQCENPIRVIHQSNKGVSAARNVGLDVAQGKFIAFIDADDVVTSEYLNALFLLQKETNADLVGTWYKCVDDNLKPIEFEREIHEEKYQNHTLHHFASKHPEFFGTVWGKLMRKDLIDEYKLKFSTELCRGEDTLFICSYAAVCKEIATNNRVMYFYRKYENSSTGRTSSLWLEQSICLVDLFLFFSNVHSIHTDYVIETSLKMRFHILGDFMTSTHSISTIRKYLRLLHNSESFQDYLKFHRPNEYWLMSLYAWMMLVIPSVLQPYLFFFLNRCRCYLKCGKIGYQ